MKQKNYRLTEIDWPDFGTGQLPPVPPREFGYRITAVREAMEGRNLTHLEAYADRDF